MLASPLKARARAAREQPQLSLLLDMAPSQV